LVEAESPGTLAYLTLSLSGHETGQLFPSSELETAVVKMQLSRGAYLQKKISKGNWYYMSVDRNCGIIYL
jgi:hypothetical protein